MRLARAATTPSTPRRSCADEAVATEAAKSYVAYQPLGVVLAIMPWNFPFWQVFRFAAPALMAGNAGCSSTPSNVPGCALAHRASSSPTPGCPAGLFRTLLVGARRGSTRSSRDPRVRAVTLTGSAPAGRRSPRRPGRALKKTVLELGGSDPFVVLADADLDRGRRDCVQTPPHQQRPELHRRQALHRAATRAPTSSSSGFVARDAAPRASATRSSATTQVGPLARVDLRDAAPPPGAGAASPQGARLLLGGEVPDGPGAFYPPTVLDRRRAGHGRRSTRSCSARWPRSCRARDEADAIRLANDTSFGLGGARVHARPRARASGSPRAIDAGLLLRQRRSCAPTRACRSAASRQSGYGRELAEFGIREFVNVKTVWIGAGA